MTAPTPTCNQPDDTEQALKAPEVIYAFPGTFYSTVALPINGTEPVRFVRGSVFDDYVGTLLNLLEDTADGGDTRDRVKAVLTDDDFVEIRKRWRAL